MSFTRKIHSREVGKLAPKRTQALRKPAMPAQTNASEKPGAVVVSPPDSAIPTTKEELISRAKCKITSIEISCIAGYQEVAEDVALACKLGATQREVALGVCKSAAWVNRLLKWRDEGYVGAPFRDKIVQGLNKEDQPMAPASAELTSAGTCAARVKIDSFESKDRERVVETVNTAPALVPLTMVPSSAPASNNYHLPPELNRQDPERAFQRLVERWASNPFRDLFLDSPKAAQERFVRDVLLPEFGVAELITPVNGNDANAAKATAGVAS